MAFDGTNRTIFAICLTVLIFALIITALCFIHHRETRLAHLAERPPFTLPSPTIPYGIDLENHRTNDEFRDSDVTLVAPLVSTNGRVL
jgi:hypothetical protein